MPQKAHIVSFEQAKRASGKARPSVPLSKKQSTRRTAEKTTSRSVSKAPASSTRTTTSSSSRPRRTASSSSARSASSAPRPSARTPKRAIDNHARPKVQTAQRNRAASSVQQTSTRRASSPKTSSSRKASPSAPARTSANRNATSQRRESATQTSKRQTKKTLRETMQDRRHSARKKRADRDFDKQVDTTSSRTEEQGSRAAVYQTRMGTSHKRAARMQNAAVGAAAATGHAVRDAGFSWRNSPRFVATVGIVACLIFGCAFLYPAARDYYVATRTQSQLQAEYAAVQARNEALQNQVNFMSTSEGVEAKAREDYGWVQPGEVSVSVAGLEAQSDNSVDVYASIPEGSVAAPETWYSSLLDPLFGYSG